MKPRRPAGFISVLGNRVLFLGQSAFVQVAGLFAVGFLVPHADLKFAPGMKRCLTPIPLPAVSLVLLPADLMLVDGDPIANIKPIEDPAKNFVVIIKDGKIYKNLLPR